MSSEKKLANAMGAKTARACDNCIRKRARWYCAADDAFLCQSCDSSVHSANPLARRHERVRLKTSSFKASDDFPNLESTVSGLESGSGSDSIPSWHCGFTRKARTPRYGNKHAKRVKSTEEEEEEEEEMKNPIQLVVPEILSDENSHDENEEEQLLYRVPIFDPFMADGSNYGNEYSSNKVDFNQDMNTFQGLLAPSEMELAEFAADVESLLGKGLDDEESFNYMEGLGFLEKHDEKLVKVEDEGEVGFVNMISTNNQVDYSEFDMVGETFELKFDYDSQVINNLDEDNKKVEFLEINYDSGKNNNKIMLNLDYESVLKSWADKRSPWTTGVQPQVDFNDCWPVCMGNCGKIHSYGDIAIMNGHGGGGMDEGREARVLRYKEKRRTRLFSKKIRYEVRKLNAEKRPRMKGRFVKRTNFAPTPFPSLNK